ncbi:RNA polymerase sigma-70 factor [Spirosoma daeguense]
MNAPEVNATFRSTLLGIAYRMTGEVMTSEDIVQDVLLKWLNHSQTDIQDSNAYLAKSVTNAALNHLAQMKRQRDAYKGIWLAEPVLESHRAVDARLDISYGFMLLLEKLSPLERAVFVLKESFDIPYTEIAQLFDTNEANCRQLYRRAKEKIASEKRRFSLDNQQKAFLLEAFTNASKEGDVSELVQLLKNDVVLYSDGGGKAIAAVRPLIGAQAVGQFLRSISQKYGHALTVEPTLINGEIALLFTQKETGQVDTVMVFEIDDAGISQIFTVRNPDKLVHVQ